MRRAARWLLWLALSTSGCDRRGYIAITVKLGTLAGRVDRLALQAFDAHGDAGPQLIPAVGPEPEGIPNNSVIAVSTPVGNSLTVVVNGLGVDGESLGVGSATIASATGNTQVSVTLAAPCFGPRDCDPSAVCLGTQACLLGTCQPAAGPIADAGAACGPSDGGHCDGVGACLLPYCGDGVLEADAGEQCDQGLALNGTLPDHCRADCRLPGCGDGIVDPDAGEICDLAGLNGQELGCNATCNLTGAVTLLAGDGTKVSSDGFGTDAGFAWPGALAVVGSGLFVADELSHLIRRVDLTTGEVTTIAGGFDGGACDVDGQGSGVSFCGVTSLLAYNGGLIVGDVSVLRLVSVTGKVITFAGVSGTPGVTLGPFSKASYRRPPGPGVHCARHLQQHQLHGRDPGQRCHHQPGVAGERALRFRGRRWPDRGQRAALRWRHRQEPGGGHRPGRGGVCDGGRRARAAAAGATPWPVHRRAVGLHRGVRRGAR